MASDELDSFWEVIGDIPVLIWFCPDRREHARKRDPRAPMTPTVDWIDGVAHCLEPGCNRKSTDKKERS